MGCAVVDEVRTGWCGHRLCGDEAAARAESGHALPHKCADCCGVEVSSEVGTAYRPPLPLASKALTSCIYKAEGK